MTHFAFEDQFSQIGHAARVQDTVKVIAFMLDDTGMESFCRAGDFATVHIEAAIADVKRTFDEAAQARHRKASLPATLKVAAHDLDFGIDQDGQRCGVIEALGEFGVAATLGRLKHDDAHRDMDLRRSDPLLLTDFLRMPDVASVPVSTNVRPASGPPAFFLI